MVKSRIKEVVIAVTYRCNSRCQMCHIWKQTDHQQFDLAELHYLPKKLIDINLTGGEPFLRPDLADIIKLLKEQSPSASVIISSNGFATETIDRQIREILKINPDVGVAISVDGIGKVHERIRGISGGFGRVKETIQRLRQRGVKKLRVSFTLGDYNVNELKKVYQFSQQQGVEFSLTLVHSSEQYFNTENKIEKTSQMAEALDWLIQQELASWNIKRWLRAYYAYGMKYFVQTGRRILPDYSGRENIFIDPLGNFYPSDISMQKIGSLKQGIMNTELAPEHPSWMICTVRQAMRKHSLRVGWWILRNKFMMLFK